MGCLRLVRAMFEGYAGSVLEGLQRVLDGKTITIQPEKHVQNLCNAIKYYLKLPRSSLFNDQDVFIHNLSILSLTVNGYDG